MESRINFMGPAAQAEEAIRQLQRVAAMEPGRRSEINLKIAGIKARLEDMGDDPQEMDAAEIAARQKASGFAVRLRTTGRVRR